jgi:biopolymer transport protein ExbD
MSDDPRSYRQINLPLLLGVVGAILLVGLGGMALTAYVAWRWYHDSSEGVMEFCLPASGETGAADSTASDREELNPQITVVIRAVREGANKGTIRDIVVRAPNGTSKLRTLPELAQCLKKQRPQLTNNTDIQIEAETALKYSYLIDAMDTCVKEGFTHVGFAPPPDLTNDD